MVYVYNFFDRVKYLGVWINASLKDDDDDIQGQVKSLCCAAKKLRGTFDQCSPAVINTLFRAYCMRMYACQLWSKYTQTSMNRLRAAYNNAYRIMHYISRNVMRYCMDIHFLYFCEWRCSCGDDKVFYSSQCWSCANTVSVMQADI